MLVHGARQAVAHHVGDDAHQAARLHGQAPPQARALGTRQRQQLVDGVRGTDAGARDLGQGLPQLARTHAFALGQFGLHAQPGQRRLELVGRVGQEALLRGQRVAQAAQQVIDRIHQRHDFQRHVLVVDGRKVLGPARADALLQPVQRLDAARQRQPHQQRGQRQDDELRQHHALDDFRGQHAALFARLGHLNQGLRFARQGHAHPDMGHAQIDAAKFRIAQLHGAAGRQAWRRRASQSLVGLGRRRQVALAG